MKKINRISLLLSFIALAFIMLTSNCKKDETETPVLSKPVLTTTAASNISYITALCGGNITSEGSSPVSARGVCWNTEPDPTISNNKTIDGSGTGSFVTIIPGLRANTKYYARAYASNSVGTGYGNELIFNTLSYTFIGYAVGEFTILKTVNGSSTWTSLSIDGLQLSSVYFTDDFTGFAVGLAFNIFKTIDGGSTWNEPFKNNSFDSNNDNYGGFESINFSGKNTGFAVGTWTRLWTPSHAVIAKTSDGGTTWNWTDLYIFGYAISFGLSSVYFTDENTGYAAGGYDVDSENHGGTIIKTIDGGTTWTVSLRITDSILSEPSYLSSVYFTDANTGYAVGEGGTILKTTDAGATWTSLLSGITNGLGSVFFTDANTGYAVGGGGTILNTTDAGATWSPLASGTTNTFHSVFFADANRGYVVGDGGTILRTIDGGATWTADSGGTTENLYSVFFVKPK